MEIYDINTFWHPLVPISAHITVDVDMEMLPEELPDTLSKSNTQVDWDWSQRKPKTDGRKIQGYVIC